MVSAARRRHWFGGCTLPLVASLTIPPAAAALPARGNATSRCDSGSCTECSVAPTELRVVRVKLYNQTRMDDSGIAPILEVANRIWTGYGVSVEATDSTDAITVVVARGILRGETDDGAVAVGDTLFTEGHATPYIHLWLGAAERLARNSGDNAQPFTAKPPDERDAILQRMLGVALAHEIAHYLLDSADHSAAGLLRGTLTARDMADPNPAHLRLSRRQQELMCRRGRWASSTLSAGATSGSGRREPVTNSRSGGD